MIVALTQSGCIPKGEVGNQDLVVIFLFRFLDCFPKDRRLLPTSGRRLVKKRPFEQVCSAFEVAVVLNGHHDQIPVSMLF